MVPKTNMEKSVTREFWVYLRVNGGVLSHKVRCIVPTLVSITFFVDRYFAFARV